MTDLASTHKLESEDQGRQLMSTLPYACTYVHMRLHTTHIRAPTQTTNTCMHTMLIHIQIWRNKYNTKAMGSSKHEKCLTCNMLQFQNAGTCVPFIWRKCFFPSPPELLDTARAGKWCSCLLPTWRTVFLVTYLNFYLFKRCLRKNTFQKWDAIFPQKCQDRKKMLPVRKKNYREKFLNLMFLYNWEKNFVTEAWWWRTHATCDHNNLYCGFGAPNIDLHCELPQYDIYLLWISSPLKSGAVTCYFPHSLVPSLRSQPYC